MHIGPEDNKKGQPLHLELSAAVCDAQLTWARQLRNEVLVALLSPMVRCLYEIERALGDLNDL